MRIGVDLAAHEDLRGDLADELAEQAVALVELAVGGRPGSSHVVSRSPSMRVIVSTRFVDAAAIGRGTVTVPLNAHSASASAS